MLQKYILIPLFSLIWHRRLWTEHWYHPGHWKRMPVIKVKGWRTAIVDQFHGERATITFCLWRWN